MFTPDQENVLVDDSGRARIADFGLAMVTKNLDSKPSDAHQRGHTVGFAAPEVMEKGVYSKEADMFSFAMVMVEVCHR
jgi:serine/threonine protein kinase